MRDTIWDEFTDDIDNNNNKENGEAVFSFAILEAGTGSSGSSFWSRLVLMKMTKIYIMMKCLCVWNEKWSLSPLELSARGGKGDACQAFPAVGRLWPSDNNDEDDEDDDAVFSFAILAAGTGAVQRH